MYDAIVVGARCAGSVTAMLLARAGLSVLLVDKASFPSDTLSTHYIHQPGVARLKRWGLLDRVAASGCPPIEQQLFDAGPITLRGTPPPFDGVTTGYAPRRTILDTILFEAAAEAGAEVRTHFSVKELLTESDRVVGIRGRSDGGAAVEDRAHIVIGADGMRSRVAQLAGAPLYEERPAHSCAYYTYWSGVSVDCVELYPRPDRMLIAAPTNDGLTLTIAYWPDTDFPTIKHDIEPHFMAALDLVPGLSERVRAGERVEKFRGTAELDGFYRRPYGPGWALVGDAGYHKNPITAQGITDSFRDAELLFHAISETQAGANYDAFAEYERARNEATMPLYQMTADLAQLKPPAPEVQAILSAIQGDPMEAGRFLGTIAGTVPIPEYFSPDNIEAILGAPVS